MELSIVGYPEQIPTWWLRSQGAHYSCFDHADPGGNFEAREVSIMLTGPGRQALGVLLYSHH